VLGVFLASLALAVGAAGFGNVDLEGENVRMLSSEVVRNLHSSGRSSMDRSKYHP
jgi:hypothetical protein